MTLADQLGDILSEFDLEPTHEDDISKRSNAMHEIATTMAYLIGVPDQWLDVRNDLFESQILKRLRLEKKARIIRNLCRIRTAFIKDNYKIYSQMAREHKGLYTIEEIPQDALSDLESDGIKIVKSGNYPKNEYMKDINNLISQRIHDCKSFFPDWMPWDYVKDVFTMPEGHTERGIKRASEIYYEHKSGYPYACYINGADEAERNILMSDRILVSEIYRWHGDEFSDVSKVQDIAVETAKNIKRFFQNANKIVIAIDCENSDPYRMCNCLNTIDEESGKKVCKILLINDVHASTGWKLLESYTDIPVEEIMIERLYDHKSTADIRLSAEVSKEHYKNDIDSFIIVSSDSDFWSVVEALSSAKFMFMMEGEKCGSVIREKLEENGYFYCFLNNFYSGDQMDVINKAVTAEFIRSVNATHLSIEDIFNDTVKRARTSLDSAQEKELYKKIIGRTQFTVNEDGELEVSVK